MHRVQHDHERIPYPIRHMVRQVLPGPCHDMTCLIQVHDTIHDFPKDTHAALRANGSSVGAYPVDTCPVDADFVWAGFVDVGSVGAGSVGAGSEPAPTGGGT